MSDLQQYNRRQNFLKDLRSAILGKEKTFTSGSINRAIFMLSVPIILEMLMESLFAVVDVFYVSRLGVDAITTVGLTEAVIMIVYSLGVGLSMGVTAMVSRRIGEKKKERAADAAAQGIYIAIAMSIVLGILGALFARDLLEIMGASEEVVETGYGFTTILLGGNISIMLLFVHNAILRGAGDASIAMRALWIANGLNLILDPLFIFGLGPFEGMGVMGAAVATTIGRSVGVLYQVFMLSNGKAIIRIARENLIVQWRILRRILEVSSGGVAQYLIGSASWIFLVRIISIFGSEAVAGYTISIRVIFFTILPAWGIANAASILVGQNLGAKQPDRAEKSAWKCAIYNVIFLFVISVVFFLGAEFVVRIFSKETEVIRNGVIALRYIMAGYIIYAYGMVISQAFNGAGDTRTPTIINIFSYWLLQIPLAYLLAVNSPFEIKGVYIAILISELFLALIAIYIFRKGKWKTVKI
ncbi:MATE family efflux transporter [Bacteroidota bacterium]